jgi:hypothetical protein
VENHLAPFALKSGFGNTGGNNLQISNSGVTLAELICQNGGEAMAEKLGVCRNSDDLRAILRARFTELGISFETVDHIAGLPTRYTSKVIGIQPTRNFGQISLDSLLGAAGIMLIAVPDDAALDRVRARLQPFERVDTSAAPRRRIIIKLTPQFMREIGALGGRKSAENRRARASISETKRRAALARWHKPEVTEAAARVTA